MGLGLRRFQCWNLWGEGQKEVRCAPTFWQSQGIARFLTFRGLPSEICILQSFLKNNKEADGRSWLPYSNFGLFFITFPSLDRGKADDAWLKLGQRRMIYVYFIRQGKQTNVYRKSSVCKIHVIITVTCEANIITLILLMRKLRLRETG